MNKMFVRKQLLLIASCFLFFANFSVSPSLASVMQQEQVPEGYQAIYTTEELNQIRDNLSGRYILMNDLQLNDLVENWVPIGTPDRPFKGILDGNGYTIDHLTIEMDSQDVTYSGLFGYTNKAQIVNLGMKNTSIVVTNHSIENVTAKNYAGAIAAYAKDTIISNSFNTGDIKVKTYFNSYVGGLVGYVDTTLNGTSSVTDSSNSGTIEGTTSIGGLVGYSISGSFSNVSNSGELLGKKATYTGGIIGRVYNVNGSTSIEEAYNEGEIIHAKYGGGIIGNSNKAIINNAYNLGRIYSEEPSSSGAGILGTSYSTVIKNVYNDAKIENIGKNSEAAGIIGYLGTSSTILNAYNTGEISSLLGDAAGIAVYSSEAIVSKTYNTGKIAGLYASGIVGTASNSVLMDSFNVGDLNGEYYVGGIVKKLSGGEIKNTYNVGKLSVKSKIFDKGEIAAVNNGVISNSYHLGLSYDGVGEGSSEGVKRLTREQALNPEMYVGFDFTSTWHLDVSSPYAYPILNGTPPLEVEKIIQIQVAKQPDVANYLVGEDLNLDGYKVGVLTNFGQYKEVQVTQQMISGYDKYSPGTQTIDITIEGAKTSFKVNVLEQFTVSFEDFDGNIVKSEVVVAGEMVEAPDLPPREGYDFIGWNHDGYLSVHRNLIIQPMYTAKKYDVQFIDGQQIVSTKTYPYGAEIELPEAQNKDAFVFAGWYKDAQFKERVQNSEKVTKNVSYYARYEKVLDGVTGITVKPYDSNSFEVTWNPVKGATGYIIYYADRPDPSSYYGQYFGNETSGVIWGLELGETYYFRVEAYRDLDENTTISSVESEWVESKLQLKAPVLSKVTANSTYETYITWEPSYDVNQVEIYRATSQNGTYKLVKTIASLYETSYLDSNLAAGTNYYYKIRAVKLKDGQKFYSSYSAVKSVMTQVSSISNATVKSTNGTSLTVSWAAASNITGYEVYSSTAQNGTYKLVKTIVGKTTFTNTGLTTNQKVFYKVRAYKTVDGKKVYGSYSAVKSNTPTLTIPTGIAAKKASNTSITVTWKKAADATGYEVYRSTAQNGSYTKINTITSINKLTVTNTKLSNGKTYYFKVRTYRTVNGKKIYSKYSSVVKLKL